MKIFVLLIAILLACSSQAQTDCNYAHITQGPIVRDTKTQGFYESYKLPNDQILTIRFVKNGFRIRSIVFQVLDAKLNIVKSLITPLKDKIHNLDFEYATMLGNELAVLKSETDKEAQIYSLYIETYNPETLQPITSLQKITDIPYDNKLFQQADFFIKESEDRNYLMIYSLYPTERNENEKIKITVIDKELNQIWTKDLTLEYLDKDVRVYSFLIDNNGNAYLMLTIRNRGEDITADERWQYRILSFRDKGQTQNDYFLKLPEGYISDFIMKPFDDKTLMVAGIYGAEKASVVSGSFFMKINAADGQIEFVNTSKFSIDFLVENLTERQTKNTIKKLERGKDVGMYDYEMRDLVMRSDGGLILIAEQYQFYVTSYMSRGPNGTMTTTYIYHYVYNNIIVVNIEPDGTISWNVKIPKFQHSTDDGGYASSYLLMIDDENLYFIYNDVIDNLAPNTKKFYNFLLKGKAAVTTIARIGPDGSLDRTILSRFTERKMIPIPRYSLQISNNQAYIILWNKKKQTNALIEINN